MLIAYYFMWFRGRTCGGAVRGVHLGYIAGPRAVLYPFSRRHIRRILPRPVQRERPVPQLHGMGNALVLSQRTRSKHSWLDAGWAGCTSFATCDKNPSVFETYWTTIRGVEVMDNNYHLLDLTVYGRQETWEDSPAGWPHKGKSMARPLRTNGRPIAQWSRLKTGYSDDLGTGAATRARHPIGRR